MDDIQRDQRDYIRRFCQQISRLFGSGKCQIDYKDSGSNSNYDTKKICRDFQITKNGRQYQPMWNLAVVRPNIQKDAVLKSRVYLHQTVWTHCF